MMAIPPLSIRHLARQWTRVSTRFLPFADAASRELPLGRLLRLALFQVSVGMAIVLLTGTLNRVMIVELGIAAWLVALMVALPLVFAPLRALIGFRSDHYRSYLGWKRVPYIWLGTLAQFGGFAILPFALLIMTGEGQAPAWVGELGAAVAFLLVGAGMHTTQTAGLALATDIAPPASRPRVVALLYVMLLLGMVMSSVAFGALLADFSPLRLVQVIQGAAVVTFLLNVVALWKQEPRDPNRILTQTEAPSFRAAWGQFSAEPRARRLLIAIGVGTAAFSMQDVLLEPYGGQVLNLAVSATTLLTALVAGGALIAFALAGRLLGRGTDPHRLAAYGALIGTVAFAAVILAAPLDSLMLFRCGTILIGFAGGLFSVGTLIAAMELRGPEQSGLALGAYGAVQATCAGIGIAAGGALRDLFSSLAASGILGKGATSAATGYWVVYQIEIVLLFICLIAIGPLVRPARASAQPRVAKFGLAEFPN